MTKVWIILGLAILATRVTAIRFSNTLYPKNPTASLRRPRPWFHPQFSQLHAWQYSQRNAFAHSSHTTTEYAPTAGMSQQYWLPTHEHMMVNQQYERAWTG